MLDTARCRVRGTGDFSRLPTVVARCEEPGSGGGGGKTGGSLAALTVRFMVMGRNGCMPGLCPAFRKPCPCSGPRGRVGGTGAASITRRCSGGRLSAEPPRDVGTLPELRSLSSQPCLPVASDARKHPREEPWAPLSVTVMPTAGAATIRRPVSAARRVQGLRAPADCAESPQVQGPAPIGRRTGGVGGVCGVTFREGNLLPGHKGRAFATSPPVMIGTPTDPAVRCTRDIAARQKTCAGLWGPPPTP